MTERPVLSTSDMVVVAADAIIVLALLVSLMAALRLFLQARKKKAQLDLANAQHQTFMEEEEQTLDGI